MKKILLFTFVFAATIFTASAQTEKGKWLVGTSMELSTYKSTDPNEVYPSKEKYIQFNPEVGYFIKDNLALGLLMEIQNAKYQDINNDVFEYNSFLIGPSAKYYLPLAKHFNFYSSLSIPFGSNIRKDTGLSDVKTQIARIELNPGFAFFPTNNIGIEFGLGRLRFESTKTGEEKTNAFTFGVLGNHMSLGVKLHLGK